MLKRWRIADCLMGKHWRVVIVCMLLGCCCMASSVTPPVDGGRQEQQRRKPLRHLGMSRGDGEFAWVRTLCLLRSGLFSEFGT